MKILVQKFIILCHIHYTIMNKIMKTQKKIDYCCNKYDDFQLINSKLRTCMLQKYFFTLKISSLWILFLFNAFINLMSDEM